MVGADREVVGGHNRIQDRREATLPREPRSEPTRVDRWGTCVDKGRVEGRLGG